MSQPSGGGQLPPASPQPGWVTLRAKRPRPLPRPPSLALAAPQRALPSGSLSSRWVARWDSASERLGSADRYASFGPLSDKLGNFRFLD